MLAKSGALERKDENYELPNSDVGEMGIADKRNLGLISGSVKSAEEAIFRGRGRLYRT